MSSTHLLGHSSFEMIQIVMNHVKKEPICYNVFDGDFAPSGPPGSARVNATNTAIR